MKTLLRNQSRGTLRKLSVCSAANAIHIDGQVFVPDAATAYIEFYMAHTFPVYLDQAAPGERPDFSTLHPQVVANSYRSLVGKVFNLAHLMKAYDEKANPRDRILGTVMAVEFPETPAGGWRVQGDPCLAPGIRAVAALHKNAEGVAVVLDTWAKGCTPFTETVWTVSMENESYIDSGGFLVSGGGDCAELADFVETTPEDFRSLGWVYVPVPLAPKALAACLRDDEYIGLRGDYRGRPTLFLNGGLDGKIFFYGVGLVPQGKESAARVGRIVAGGGMVDLSGAFDAIAEFARRISA